MNNEMAGNIMSLVNGLEDILAAVAKELNATSTVDPTGLDDNLSTTRWEAPTWNTTPECCVQCLYQIAPNSIGFVWVDKHSQSIFRFS